MSTRNDFCEARKFAMLVRICRACGESTGFAYSASSASASTARAGDENEMASTAAAATLAMEKMGDRNLCMQIPSAYRLCGESAFAKVAHPPRGPERGPRCDDAEMRDRQLFR